MNYAHRGANDVTVNFPDMLTAYPVANGEGR